MKHRHGKTTSVSSGLVDLSEESLADVSRSVSAGEVRSEDVDRRICPPRDGGTATVPVAASFNSAV
ncbi:hypothetical protein Caci_7954 [Catenulispora acidiphila DSM 44928]|jgi:hypothetical protein|uniref:Uncharacterized protein n=1 Tax=Catenulispora acidiphila (strain DSM 44928 / JCM 14897 / NBRC 102108 / NRRL B-24433 / ID139908) TaxID=479433 RepID=C7QFK0_CATAD|nr:hypothetical protein [Catenulispora acidiphila]ACU76777.1 hypothetical protein Caci_7954 [Catenulispora acidiphila DSM 44928]